MHPPRRLTIFVLTTFSSPERRAFNGLGLAIVRTGAGDAGEITWRVESEGLIGAVVTLQTE